MAKEATDRKRDLEDICEVMGTVAGRRWFWRRMAKSNMFSRCFTGNSETFYREGRREAALEELQEVMVACPELYWKAKEENWKRNQRTEDEGNGRSNTSGSAN